MIQPSTLNLLIIGACMIIFTFLWRMAAAKLSENEDGVFGPAFAVAL